MKYFVAVSKTKDGSLEFVYKHNNKFSVGVCVDNKKEKIEYAKTAIRNSIAAIELMGFINGDDYEKWHLDRADYGDKDMKGMKEKISKLVDFEFVHEITEGEKDITNLLNNHIFIKN